MCTDNSKIKLILVNVWSLPSNTPHFGLISPFLTSYHGGNPDRNYSISNPVPTLDCSNRFGIVEPFILATGHTSSKHRNRSINRPLSTVVTKAEHCLIQAVPERMRGILLPHPFS